MELFSSSNLGFYKQTDVPFMLGFDIKADVKSKYM